MSSKLQKNAVFALGFLASLSAQDFENLHAHHHHHHAINEPQLNATIGVFGKSSSLASSTDDGRFKKDSYSMLYSSVAMSSRAFDLLDVGLGVVGYMPFDTYTGYVSGYAGAPEGGEKEVYVGSRFVANTAYVGIERAFGDFKFSGKAGRFEEEFDWVMCAMQGAAAQFGNSYFRIYGAWVDDQAHITREIATDFDFYKSTYHGKKMLVSGVDFYLPFAQISPYFYRMQQHFDVYGARAQVNFGSFSGLHTSIVYSYSRLNSKNLGAGAIAPDEHEHEHAGHGHEAHAAHAGPSHIMSALGSGESYFSSAEIALGYSNFWALGAGYSKVGAHYFEIANMGSLSRFEVHGAGHIHGFGVLRPGGIHTGSQTTNMYNENVRSVYGFFDVSFGDFALEILARNSSDYKYRAQEAYSVGVRYNFWLDFELGAIAVYMLDKAYDYENGGSMPRVNKSFGKAYVQYSF